MASRATVRSWEDRARVAQPLAPRTAFDLKSMLARWLAAETGAGRLAPWMPVAFGTGAMAYLAAETEPSLIAAWLLATALAALVFAARHRPRAFPLAVLAALAAAGFATAVTRTALVAHPVLERPLSGASVTGWVELREERERTDRITVRVVTLAAGNAAPALERLRVATRKGQAPPAGTFVSFRARLVPPMQPLRPGGYDFARELYLRGIGASGFVLGAVRTVPPPDGAVAATSPLRAFRMAVEGLRDRIDHRIRQTVAGDDGVIASALITGRGNAISTPVRDALFISGLGHVLSISGYHMAVVAGLVFFAVRFGLALVPAVTLRHPVKKWAAGIALLASAFYLVLSGAELATQRSFVMLAVVLAAVMADRQAVTLRTLAIAAFVVLVFAPDAVAHPSFQMSFAATLVLVALYERGLPFLRPAAGGAWTARIALWGGREVAMLLTASLVAGLATTPFVAFHFHRVTPYSPVANLLAMPVISALVMPAGIAGLIAMPFGFDAPFWRLMAWGIGVMDDVALWVAGWPGALMRLRAFGEGPLLLATAGLLGLCLLRGPLRGVAVLPIAAATAWALAAPAPDLYVAADGQSVAVRQADGRLSVMRAGSGDAFALGEWLAADADGRTAKAESLAAGRRCDAEGCTLTARDGTLVSLALTPAAVAEDCELAAIVVTPRTAPPSCSALALDRTQAGAGTQIIYLDGAGRAASEARSGGASNAGAPSIAASKDTRPDGAAGAVNSGGLANKAAIIASDSGDGLANATGAPSRGSLVGNATKAASNNGGLANANGAASNDNLVGSAIAAASNNDGLANAIGATSLGGSDLTNNATRNALSGTTLTSAVANIAPSTGAALNNTAGAANSGGLPNKAATAASDNDGGLATATGAPSGGGSDFTNNATRSALSGTSSNGAVANIAPLTGAALNNTVGAANSGVTGDADAVTPHPARPVIRRVAARTDGYDRPWAPRRKDETLPVASSPSAGAARSSATSPSAGAARPSAASPSARATQPSTASRPVGEGPPGTAQTRSPAVAKKAAATAASRPAQTSRLQASRPAQASGPAETPRPTEDNAVDQGSLENIPDAPHSGLPADSVLSSDGAVPGD